MIPQNIIEDLKYRSDIVDVISSYVPLKRSGSNLSGLCPFHSERSPSFTVFPGGDPHFYCFGCGAGGDVISFIMRMENLGYREALEFLARRAGITLPEDDGRRDDGGVGRKRIFEMNICAARFFRDMLNHESVGAPARAYLESRRLPAAIVRRFGLGYAPNSFHALHDHLARNGFTDEEMTAGYCCGISQYGKPFDLFRGRLMFPIIDVSGNIVAFGGRVLDDAKPKYLNSSDTPAFKKSRNLFALNFAKSKCSERLILCEGYMDVIMLHAAGFENAVATLGTAITSDHARIVRKYTPKAVLAYDSDEAGQNATRKALRILDEAGVDARVLVMNGAKDPDEYIKKFGAEKFSALLDGSVSRFDYKLKDVISSYDISLPDEKIRAAAAVCAMIAETPSSVEREVYISRAAQALSVDAGSLGDDVRKQIRKRQFQEKKKRPAELYRSGMGISDRLNPDFARRPRASHIEERILGMILLRREYIGKPVDGNPLRAEEMATDLGRRILAYIFEKEEQGGFDFSMLSEAFSQEEVSRAMKMKMDRQQLSDNGPEIFANEIRALREENERAQHTGDDDFLYVLRKRQEQLAKDHSNNT